MSVKKKKKIKLKWKNIILLCIFMFIVGFSFTKLTSIVINLVESPKKETNNKQSKDNNKTNKELSEQEKKLQELDNINEKISYFDMNNIDRYIKYKKDNPSLEITQIIKNVEMDLDKEVYTDSTEVKNLNDVLILVNKHNNLKDDYEPDNLKNISNQYALNGMQLVDYAKDAFESMASDAKKEKLSIIAMSSYRSYDYQVNLYNNNVKKDGREAADTYSGRPGYSEHQTGLAVDVYNGKVEYTKFEETKEFTWMNNNAYKYGFILRFPKNKENETGYIYESWHYRYVGKDIAKYIKDNDISFEEYIATKKKED